MIGNELLAKAVVYFYRNAWTASTTRTYKTGQRRWAKFTAAYPVITNYPFSRIPLQEYELALAFFAAHLALQPTISRGTTVASYLTHVRADWRQAGCPEDRLSSEFVALVTRGIHRALPATPDSRQAFLLLSCRPSPCFRDPSSPASFQLKFATLLGFFGMLRISAFSKLAPAAIILVSASGRQSLLTAVPLEDARSICREFIGFFFRFRGKSTPIGDPPPGRLLPAFVRYSPRIWYILPPTSVEPNARARILPSPGKTHFPEVIYCESHMPVFNAACRRWADFG